MKKRNLTTVITSSYIDASNRFITSKNRGKKRIMVYVEGYEDIPFWREILDRYESDKIMFDVNVPTRQDMAKGKRVLMSMAQGAGESMILCMDSDFDYIFQSRTAQSKAILSNKYIFHTYGYSIENLLCYSPSLKKIAVRASKNDSDLFDIEKFINSYSSIIYPLFLWYCYSALLEKRHMFILADFKNAIKLHYVDINNSGVNTLEWLKRGVRRRLSTLESENSDLVDEVKLFGQELKKLGVERDNCYLYMNGHALMDNVVVIVNSVVDKLRDEQLSQIRNSSIKGTTLSIEMSNYKNSLLKVSELLRNNVGYVKSDIFKNIERDLDQLFKQ